MERDKGKIENTEIKIVQPITYIHTLKPYRLHLSLIIQFEYNALFIELYKYLNNFKYKSNPLFPIINRLI
jgi:hypothetical protein